MPNTHLEKTETKTKIVQEEPNLKGTFIAVMFVFAFLVGTWFSVWGIFLNR
ncbi:cytochrome c oxidase subunit 2A [Pontibacillus sp. HMF3514]|uniref:cytochrome c oxidase subunit 2A n=1 Tax=Pontibacillus sp. HMF3514 TaxID=2692425 RepID=UPI00131FCAE2|nr:cytochrome c oxidase subunit 2A [Pontibacillus sp. HMF3514]QHE52470.1 cytochrome c oxidase subunit 2A [Pontibacillus sp. HMF3514]